MQSLWLANRKYDAAFFHLPALACLLLLLPYARWGTSAVLPIYTAYLVFFGLPHNYLTWSTILPRNAGRSVDMELVKTASLAVLAFCILIPLSAGTDLNDWLLTGIGLLSLWHAYRQHHGICKIYDAVQARRTGDMTIFADRKALNLFFGLAVFGVVVWAFTKPELTYFLLPEEKYRFVHPVVPWEIFRLYEAVTLAAGAWGFKRAVIDRARDGKFIPWPQLSLMALALATFIVPYLFLPIEAMPLAVAIATVFHNVQYFGFVWLYERNRTEDLPQYEALLGTPQRLAREGAWKHYFGYALAFSGAVIAIYVSLPHQAGAFVIYFLAVSHYIVDGYLWRRDRNRAMPRVVDRMAGIALRPEGRLRRVI